MAYLTKSRFTLGLTCPQKLVYEAKKDEYADQRQDNEMMQGLAEGGHQIGALAQSLFRQADGLRAFEITSKGQQDQIAQTKEALQTESVTLFEPTIVHQGYLVRVDVLRKEGDRVELIEVKSKSFDSKSDDPGKNPVHYTKAGAIDRKFVRYVQDLAFQYWVVSKAYPQWDIHCSLMMPDKSERAGANNLHQRLPVQFEKASSNTEDLRARVDSVEDLQGERLGQSFLKLIPMNDKVQHVLDTVLEIPGMVDKFADVAAALAEIRKTGKTKRPPPIGPHCKTCEFYTPDPTAGKRSGFHECWAAQFGKNSGYSREDTVFGFYSPARSGARSTRGLLNANYLWLSDIDPDAIGLPEEPVGRLTTGDRQRMQLVGDWPDGGDYYFDRAGFKEVLSACNWPLYFLDFEAARSPLPFRAGVRPNAIQIFQYSLHVMEADGSIRHADEFLDLSPEGDVNVRMLRRLRDALGDSGTILRWTAYENTVLNDVRSQLLSADNPPSDAEELIEFINWITHEKQKKKIVRQGDRDMVDQAAWAEQFYFHPATRGKYSIKPLLPAVMESSDFLRELYSQPVYGTDALPSKNFKNMQWWVQAEEGRRPRDPYALLESTFSPELLSQGPEVRYYQRFESIQNGGGATMAYTRSQSGLMPAGVKSAIEKGLKQYCELDTLAMVMIMQAWRAEAGI